MAPNVKREAFVPGSTRDHIIATLLIAVMVVAIALSYLADRREAPLTTQDRCYMETSDPLCLPSVRP